MQNYKNMFKNKTILVTGGTGTLGQVIVRRLLDYAPAAVRVYSRDESRQFDMANELAGEKSLRFFIGDIRDSERLDRAFESVDYVYHMAAMKHVGACEYNPSEAVKTNIIGTQNVMSAAIRCAVKAVLFTSSDKAVNPSNAMGASKLMAERLVTAANSYQGKHPTRFFSVRLGNVLGSRGSIIPIITGQLAENKAITLTDPDMTRYIIKMEDIVEFLLGVTNKGKDGEVFVPKMPVVKTPDLLQAIVNVYCKKYGKDASKVKTKIIGARPGEKNYEELLTEEEALRTWENDSHYLIKAQIGQNIPQQRLKSGQYKRVKPGAVASNNGKHLSVSRIGTMIKTYI